MKELICRYFKINERGSSVKTELLGGLINFLAVAYIVILNPSLYSQTGMEFGGLFMATIAVMVIGCLFMGIVANYPIVIAPGIGIGAYTVFTVVVEMGYSWQSMLGCCFVSAVIFLILSLTSFREQLIKSIPECMKIGITAGIGLFIVIIGLKSSGIVVASPDTLVTLGDLRSFGPLMTFLGILIALVFVSRNNRAAFIITMLFATVLAIYTGNMQVPDSFVDLPENMTSGVMMMDLSNIHTMIPVVIMILMITMFDTTGTMIGVARQAKLMKKDGTFPNLRSALMADAFASFWGGILGMGPCSSFGESAAGVAAGARTGLAAVVSGLLFILLIFFSPIAAALASVPAITTPMLLIAGISMFSDIRNLDWDDYPCMISGVITCLMMPFTYSITDGVGIGMICYTTLMLFTGRRREIHPMLYLFCFWFMLTFAGII